MFAKFLKIITSLYFVRVTCKTFVGKKNLFSKKVISKASLKILEVNSHA